MRKVWVLFLFLTATTALVAQEDGASAVKPPIVIGVAPVANSGAEFNPPAERDQLIREIQAAAQSRKPPLAVEAVALQGNDRNKLSSEARDHECEYVVLATVSLQSPPVTPAVQGGVRSSVGSRQLGGAQLHAYYSLLRPGESKPVASGAALSAGGIEPSDLGGAVRSALRDLALRILRDIQKERTPAD